jgi:HlyD family secretion protein
MIKTNKTFKIAVSLLAIGAITLSGCAKKDGKDAKKEEAKKEAGRAAQSVAIAQLQSVSINPEIVVAGQVLAQNEAQVFSTASGAKVMQLLADVGQYVQAGQALAKLDARQIGADNELLAAQVRRAKTALTEAEVMVQNAEQNLARGTINGPRESALDLQQAQLAASEAKSQYDRALATTDVGALSREEVERRRTAWQLAEARLNSQRGDIGAIIDGRKQALTSARARLEGAKSDLALAIAQQKQSNARQNNGVITAPVSGLITARNVKVGEISGMSGAPMFTIVSNGALEVNAEISESEIGRLIAGMNAQFKAPDGTIAYGTLRQMPAQIDPQKRTGIAKFTLQPNPSVRAGVFLTGGASSGVRNINAMPSSAIIYDAQGASVFAVKPDNTVTKQKLTLGVRQGDIVEVISGPAVGQWVVTSGASFLAEGEKINPNKEAPKPQAAPINPPQPNNQK